MTKIEELAMNIRLKKIDFIYESCVLLNQHLNEDEFFIYSSTNYIDKRVYFDELLVETDKGVMTLFGVSTDIPTISDDLKSVLPELLENIKVFDSDFELGIRFIRGENKSDFIANFS